MIFNDFEKVKYNYTKLLGSGLGLAKPEILSGNRNFSGINMSTFQLSIPNYFKVMYESENDMVYHISGYGQTNQEALTRALGETVERYSFMSLNWLIRNRIETSTYRDLISTTDVLPLNYINIIKNDDKFFKQLKENEQTQWIKLKNYCTQRDIYYPISMLATDSFSDKPIFPTMSTGTATHCSYEKAMLNAMIEQLQIHLFMTSWYGLKKLPLVNWNNGSSPVLEKILSDLFKENSLDLIVLDCGLEDIGFYNYIAILKSKNGVYPYCSVGVQGGFNSESVLLRAVMESCAIYVGLQGFYIYKEPVVNKLDKQNILNQYNLDAPFLFWSNYNDIREKEKILDSIIDVSNKKDFFPNNEVSLEKQLSIMLKYYTKTLSYFSVLEISSLDSFECGYRTVRCIAPELIPMNCPALPYSNHPYFKKNGGIKNGNFSHPLP